MTHAIPFACAAIVLLWWWPRPGARPTPPELFDYWTDVRSIRFLTTNATSAQSLTTSRNALREASGRETLHDLNVEKRLDVVSTLESESGFPVAIALSQLHFEADTREILQRMWNEKAAVAYTSSNALIGISVILLALTSGTGSVWWIVSETAGRIVGCTAFVLIVAARWSLRRAREASQRIHESVPKIHVGKNISALLVGLAVLMISPNAVGMSAAIISSITTVEVMRALPSSRVQTAETVFASQRGWLVALLQSGISAGHDWLGTLSMIHPLLDSDLADQLQVVMTRLQWGLPAHEAFDSALWQEVAHIAKLVQEVGVRSEDALDSVRMEINNKYRSQLVTQLERVAARAVVPVSLLQLPAFILLAIVPVVATQFSSLLTIFQSTGVGLA
ncbi:MAG: hypothetical protein RL410_1601 [Actinomycetota bacterium]